MPDAVVGRVETRRWRDRRSSRSRRPEGGGVAAIAGGRPRASPRLRGQARDRGRFCPEAAASRCCNCALRLPLVRGCGSEAGSRFAPARNCLRRFGDRREHQLALKTTGEATWFVADAGDRRHAAHGKASASSPLRHSARCSCSGDYHVARGDTCLRARAEASRRSGSRVSVRQGAASRSWRGVSGPAPSAGEAAPQGPELPVRQSVAAASG